MPLILQTAPAQAPVTLAEVKAHLRVDHSDEDAGIASFIVAATQRFDGRDGLLGRCLITQTWKLTLDRFSAEIAIPLPPCQSIGAITYADSDGVIRTLSPSDYTVFGLGSADGAFVRPAFGKTWPATRDVPEAVAITFIAGYGANPADVPEPIRAAIKARVGSLYEDRESTDEEDIDFIRNHKAWSF
jgi:uncharacterized phiE125 gp8 family phage protein